MNRLISLLILMLFMSNSMSNPLSCDDSCVSSCCIEVPQEDSYCCSQGTIEESNCCSAEQSNAKATECCCSINETEKRPFVHSITYRLKLKKSLNESVVLPLRFIEVSQLELYKANTTHQLSLIEHLESPPFAITIWPTICFRC